MDSLTFLERQGKLEPQPVYVLHGDEEFLKRQAQRAIRRLVLGDQDDGFAFSSYPGDRAVWAVVNDELHTLPFLSPRRLVVIEAADPFVSRERPRLEKYFADTAGKRQQPAGVLVLDVQTWQSTTKLAKLTPEAWHLSCKAPTSHQLPQWCVQWCIGSYGKQLATAAARLLVDLVGPQMGLLDKELEKLAVYVGAAPKIDSRDVDQLVGQSRAENTWRLFDLLGEGKTGEALTLLDRLLDQGQDPMRLLGAFSLQLRRLAQAGQLSGQGVALADALSRAGFPAYPSARQAAEAQMRHLGRRRLERLYDWLLETDQGMKGGSQLPPRLLLERLVVRLGRTRG
ncbi:MAG: DNA polymerase III subunit delta [Gemmataceae bacterium]